jgi:RDD family
MSDLQLSSGNTDDSPACIVLDHFLVDALTKKEAFATAEKEETQNEIDLRTDILYVLTDKIAYRRALPFRLVVEEVQRLQIPDLASVPLAVQNIEASLRTLVKRRLVREFPSSDDDHYELAHDFLVRSVVRSYRVLDRRRISDLAVLKQRKEIADAEVERLTMMSRTISVLLRIVPPVTFGFTIYLCFLGFKEILPNGLGLSYLWLLACPALVLLLLGVAARRYSPIVLATFVLLLCGGAWMYEQSLPSVDIGTLSSGPIPRGDVCRVVIPSVFKWTSKFARSDTRLKNYPLDSADLMTVCVSGPDRAFEALREGVGYSTYLLNQDNFCANLYQLFSRVRLLPQTDFESACNQDSYSLGREVRDSYFTGFTLRPYQLNRLDGIIALCGLGLGFLHLLTYPAIILGTVDGNSVLANVTRRVWAEIFDVCLFWIVIVATVLGIDYLPSNTGTPIKWVVLIAAVGVYIAAYVILAVKRSATPGGLIAKVSILGIAGGSIIEGSISWQRLLGRQCVFTIWAALNAFFGIPTLVITPLYLALRRSHQLFYDTWFQLRSDSMTKVARKEKPFGMAKS